MRLSVICFVCTLLIYGCSGNDSGGPAAAMSNVHMDSTQFTSIEWLDSANKNFGKIPEGKKLDVTFRFRNTGDKPLVIQKVQPSCGCTVAEQPTEPILPGQEGVIRASFNSEKHVGINHKSLYVMANTKGKQNHELNFVVEVEKKKW